MKSILIIGMGRTGRHLAEKFLELGNDVMDRFKEACTAGVVDKAPKMEGRSLVMFMSAKPNK